MTRAAGLLAVAIALTLLTTTCVFQRETPSLERRAQELNRAIMCPVCPGESIDQSQNDLAKQMRVIVREQLEQGWTDEQIKAFWVERYGPSVLMEPPQHGFNLLAWVIPPIAVAVAAVGVYLVLRSMRQPRAADKMDVLATPDLSETERAEYFRRIEAALEPGRQRLEANGPRQDRKGVKDG